MGQSPDPKGELNPTRPAADRFWQAIGSATQRRPGQFESAACVMGLEMYRPGHEPAGACARLDLCNSYEDCHARAERPGLP